MRKFQLRVSGARVGDAVRPAASVRPPMTKQLGLRVHSSPLAIAPRVPLDPADYATADDYAVTK